MAAERLNGETARRPRRLVALALFSLAASLAIAMWIAGAFDTLDRAYLDVQTGLLQQEHQSDVVIVEIDARTLKALGRWPLPRAHHAQLIRNLRALGAKSLFIDVDFSSRSTPQQDAQLARALSAAPIGEQLILPAFWQPISSGADTLILSEPLPEFRTHAQLGLVNLTPGTDGLVREVSSFSELGSDAVPVWQLLRGASGPASELMLDYRLAPSSFQRLSFVDVVRGQANVSLEDKIVFVGATALELGDIVAVPVHRALPGVVVQALAYESAHRAGVSKASPAAITLLVLFWAAFCSWWLTRGRWRAALARAVTLLAGSFALVAAGYITLDLVVPLSPLVVATVVAFTGSLLSSLNAESWRSWWALRRARQQDALLRQVVDHSKDAIVTLDEHFKIRTANPAASEILGRPMSALIGMELSECAPSLVVALHSMPATGPAEVWLERAGRAGVAVEVSAAKLSWEQQRITTVTLHDVTAQRDREAELRHLALHDALTGLPNRAALGKYLEAMLAPRHSEELIALMMLDLDGFKEVNDTLGHSMGDALMRELGRRLGQLATSHRHIARLGGDEFAVLWRVDHFDQIGELAQQLLLIVEEPIVIKGVPVSLGTSIGIALCPHHAQDAESLLKRADVALYVAKRNHTRVEFYEPSDDTHSPRRLEMLTLLRAAVAKDELFLEYQPKVAIRSGEPVEVEALCRWQSPVLGRVAPGEFIALAEASDVIKPLTEWTIRNALMHCRAWRDQGVELRVAVNLSARLLQDAQLPTWLEATFVATGAEPQWLELEITESAIMTDPDRASKVLRAVQALGVLISIDDFGTGYSSLAYLRTLAVDRLKLDRSFVAGMDRGSKDQVIVESMIKLAHGLELEVVAEGIENELQYKLLRRFGCDLGQGFWIAKPMPVEALVGWYHAQLSAASNVLKSERPASRAFPARR